LSSLNTPLSATHLQNVKQTGWCIPQVVGDMLQAQIAPDHITYELLFDLPGEGDRLARVLFASLKRFMDKEALEGQYNKLLMALIRKRRWAEVELVVDQAHEEGMQLDKRTFESAIEKMAAAKKITMVRSGGAV
jgi:pentatricopeptide repeat protein